MRFRFAQTSFDCCMFDGFAEGEFDAGSIEDAIVWVHRVASAASSCTRGAVDESKLPPGAAALVNYKGPSYGMMGLIADVWRSPVCAAYAAKPTAAALAHLLTAAEGAMPAFESKAITLTPTTVKCTVLTHDDKGYGGGVVVSSSLSQARVRAELKADAILVHGLDEDEDDWWLDRLRTSSAQTSASKREIDGL
jgi:hypothetical protein